MPTPKRPPLIDAPAYTLREATRLTGISFGALHAWSYGGPATSRRRRARPIIQLAGTHWSFTNLVEAHALRALRKTHQLRLTPIRAAVRYVEEQLKVQHPLATVEFKTDGVHLFVEKFGQLINASQDGQTAMRVVLEQCLRQIEYGHNGRAARLYIDGERRLIVIDPAIRFGRPVITGTSVPVEMIVERFDAGDSIDALAADYELRTEEIEEALRSRSHLKADAA